MTVRDFLTSAVRTWVPYLVGAGLTWLAMKAGVVLDDGASLQATLGVSAVIGAVYYAAIRWAESRWKWVGWLLGLPVAPTYTTKPDSK